MGLGWKSFQRLWDGKVKRDGIAHKAKYIPQAESKKLLKLIQTNLKAWSFQV